MGTALLINISSISLMNKVDAAFLLLMPAIHFFWFLLPSSFAALYIGLADKVPLLQDKVLGTSPVISSIQLAKIIY